MIENSFKFTIMLSLVFFLTGCNKLDPTMNQLTLSTKKIDENIYLKSNYEKIYTQVKFEENSIISGVHQFEAINNMLNHYKGDFLTNVTLEKIEGFSLYGFFTLSSGVAFKIEADVWRYKKDK